MKGVKVTEIRGAFALEGVSYGPFQASAERPFLEVPEALANGLGLPRYREAGEEAEEAPDLGATLEQAQADLAREQGLRQSLAAEVERLRGEEGRLTLQLQVAEQRAQVLSDRADKLGEERDALQARVTELEGQLSEPRPAVILPPDALERIIAVKGISDKLAPLVVDALLAPAQAAPEGEGETEQ